jgi:uncharacterized membrane protein (TIGR01666 family)
MGSVPSIKLQVLVHWWQSRTKFACRMDYLKEYKSFVTSHYLSDGIRITVGITLPSIILSYFNHLDAGIVISVGAMCVSITDSPGPIHHRRNGMNACNAIIFIVSLFTGLIAPHTIAFSLFIFLCCFTFSMIGVYGNRATSIGASALLVMVLNIDRKNEGWGIVINSLYILAGGTWYTLLSLLLYSFRPYKLTQQALGECIQSTADYLRIKAAFYNKEVDYDKEYRHLLEEQVRIHEKQDLVSELLFKSRNIIRESTDTGRILVMQFLDIVDLFEVVMTSQYDYKVLHDVFGDSDILEKFRQIIIDIANDLDQTGIAIKSGARIRKTPGLQEKINALENYFEQFRDQQRTAKNVEAFISLRHILENIKDIAERFSILIGYGADQKKINPKKEEELDYEQFVTHSDIDGKLLKDNLTLKSNIFRHALRVSIATLVGFIISKFFPFGHSYWILLTVIVILKPAYSLTKKRNYDRLIGTVCGAVLGLIVLYFVKNKDVLFGFMVLFMIATYSFLRTRYLISIVFMTPYILLLFHFLAPHDFKTVLSDRLIDTAIGSVIAFLANAFILPAWEHEQVTEYMTSMLEDNSHYFADVASMLSAKPVSTNQYKLSRKNAFVSLANLSDTFNRMLSEPKNKQKNVRELHQFVVSNHMLTSHIAALAYYANSTEEPVAEDYSSYTSIITLKLDNAKAVLQHQPRKMDISSFRKSFSMLNEKINELTRKRKAELNQGITLSDTRKQLSAIKPIADQFSFINKIANDLEKLSNNLNAEQN